MKTTWLLLLICCCQINLVLGQDWLRGVQVEFPRLDKFSVDNSGQLFISDPEGNLFQFNNQGIQINLFSPQRQGRLTQVEAAWTVNIFTFSADLQEYRILDRFLKPVAENRIPTDVVNLAKAATLGNNNIIWIYDEADFTLKQLDYVKGQVIQQQPLNLILGNTSLEVVDLKEYQNMLFINIRGEGLAILDNQGNLIKKLIIKTDFPLNFWGKKLLIPRGEMLELIDYTTGEATEVPLPFVAQRVQISNGRAFVQSKDAITIYRLTDTPLKFH
jgi:hypothetical protein